MIYLKNNITSQEFEEGRNPDLKNSVDMNNYLINKNLLFKGHNNSKIYNNENDNLNGNNKNENNNYYKTIDKNNEININENERDKNNNQNQKDINQIKKLFNISRNPKEKYFLNQKKKYLTNYPINEKTKKECTSNNIKNNSSSKKDGSNFGSLISSTTTTRISKKNSFATNFSKIKEQENQKEQEDKNIGEEQNNEFSPTFM